MPSSATNSRTPQCEVRSAAVLRTSNSIGYSICRDAAENGTYLRIYYPNGAQNNRRNKVNYQHMHVSYNLTNTANLPRRSSAEGGMITEMKEVIIISTAKSNLK